MVLNDEQAGRFFDTMDALLMYVNDRLQVVENFTLDYDSQVGDLKAALVARTLWDNVEIIDEFVRENPFRLPQRCLDTALGWKVALPGLFTVVRYQSGRALLMNDRGVFAVSGVTLEIDEEIGKAPAYVELVLIPFDDLVIYDGFLQAYDTSGKHDEATRIQDEFENRCAKGIISTGAEFTEVVGAYLAAKRDDEIEALLADVAREAAGEAEVLPKGFHRGVLAGLDDIEREAAITEELRGRGPDGREALRTLAAGSRMFALGEDAPRNEHEIQQGQALNCAVASVLHRGVVEIGEAYEQYRALAPNPLSSEEFAQLVRDEATYSDAYFGIWEPSGPGIRTYLAYYTLTPDHIAQTASRLGRLDELKDELSYYESYKAELVKARTETGPRPLSRTLLENTPLGELLGNPSIVRFRRFLDERIPDGQDDYLFADLVVQELVFTSVESGNPDEAFLLIEDLGLAGCTADRERLDRLVANAFNAMPSWENNGWSPQELYEQLTGRRVFYNEDGTPMHIAPDDPCPCGSGKPYRSCCGR